MKKFHHLLAILLSASALLASCDNNDEVGSSLNESEVSVVVDSLFDIRGESVANPRVLSRTTTQLLGTVDAKGYGRLSSEIVTQFMPAADIDVDGVSVNDIDSLRLVFSIPNGGYIGDSIAPMGLEVYRLTRQLPKQIYSNFDPTGYYDPNAPLARKIYASNSQGYSDSIQNLNFRGVIIKLPVELGRELFTLYRDNPQSFQTPDAFAQHFAGLYIKNSYGGGCIIRISNTVMQMFYHKTTTDDDGKTVDKPYVGYYFGVTPEIVSNNIINYDMSAELSHLATKNLPVISAPTGYDVNITLPIPELISRFKADKGTLAVINDFTFRVAANPINNDFGITPPPSLLLVLSKDKDKFFTDNSLTDNVTSFVADYNSNSGTYTFSDMRQYIIDILAKENVTADDYTFTLTPVYVNKVVEKNMYGTTTYISSIVPYINTPSMAQIDLKKSKIIFTYSNQSIKF